MIHQTLIVAKRFNAIPGRFLKKLASKLKFTLLQNNMLLNFAVMELS